MVFVLNLTKVILIDLITDFFYWPIWWYSQGLKNAFLFVVKYIQEFWYNLALGILIRHLFKPMFGEISLQGRIISFIMRTIQLSFVILLFLIGFVFLLGLFLLWIFSPVFVVYQLIK